VACVAGALVLAVYQVEVMHSQGAGWGQAIAVESVGLVAGVVGGAATGILASNLAGYMVGGAVAGMVGSAMTAKVTGSDMWPNILYGAIGGAMGGAVAWGMKPDSLSKASAANAKGDGGSGESIAEARAQEQAAGAAAGRSSLATSPAEFDRALNDALADAFGGKEIAQAYAAAEKFDLPIPRGWVIAYDQSLPPGDYAYTSGGRHNEVVLGPRAYNSEGWLASTVGHELVHVDQIMMGNLVADPSSATNNINEIEAYDWELANSRRLGLTPTEISTLQSMRGAYVFRADPYYITQSIEGNYLVEPWDRP